MSSTFAGTQEYMAMEKLGQLRARDEWDLIVVDTPPSRSALDFLDAPARLSRFLDGRMLRLLLAPARSGGRSMFSLVTASFGLFSKVVQKILGAQLLTDLSGFVGGAGLDVRRFPAARRADVPGPAGAGDGVPAGRGAGAGRGPGGRLLRRPAARPSGCRWPAWCSTGCTGRRCRSWTPSRAGPRPSG